MTARREKINQRRNIQAKISVPVAFTAQRRRSGYHEKLCEKLQQPDLKLIVALLRNDAKEKISI